MTDKIRPGPINEYTQHTGEYFYEMLILNPNTFPFFPHLCKSIEDYTNRLPFLGKIKFKVDEICHLQKYKPGQYYMAEHCEHGPYASMRILAWMYYLCNINPENGGGTRFPHQDLELAAEEGKLYIWPSGFTHIHHGIPTKTDFKYIITGWCSYMDPMNP